MFSIDYIPGLGIVIMGNYQQRSERVSQALQTVLLSLATSLIVSLITFILGLKSGKNQTDRAKLQYLYRDLYSHFSDLKDSLNRNRPKSWESYKKVERGFYSVEYYPPVKELKRSGDILFLKKKIADEALNLEMQVMIYSSDLTRHIPEIHAALISDLGIYKEGHTFKKSPADTRETSHFETANPKGCNRFWPMNYCDLYSREEITKLFRRMNESASTAIEFTTGGNPTTYSTRIYPESITVSISEYVDHLLSALENNVEGYNELCNRKKTLIVQIEKLNKKLAQKAKDPVGFWETMFGAFADMFR